MEAEAEAEAEGGRGTLLGEEASSMLRHKSKENRIIVLKIGLGWLIQ